MHSTARSFDIDDDDRFCSVVQVEPPRNTAEASIIVSTAQSTVDTTVTSDKNSAQKPKRLRWMNVLGVRCSVSTNGTVTNTYPFLTDQSNWMDIMFVRHLLVDKPFEAPHGKGTSAWESTAHYLSLAVDPDGNLIFPLGCNGRQLKSRFQELMSVMKKIENEVPFKSGCDDEDASELQLGLEELLELHSAASSAATNSNAASAATKADDKKKAEQLRQASLGMLSPEEKRDLRNGKRRKTTAPFVLPPPMSNNHVMTDSFTEDIEARIQERKQKRDSDRNEKHALKAKQIELEKDRFRLQEETAKKRIEMDQLREDRIFRLQEQSLQLQAEMFRFFQQQLPRTTNNDDKSAGTMG
jgi:hypothetical protein